MADHTPAAGWALAWRLARRELRGGLKGFRIFILCLMIGVAAIAAVRSVSGGVLEGLREDSKSILGGDIAVRTIYQPATEAQRSYLANMGRLSEGLEMRVMARLPAGADEPVSSDPDAPSATATLVELKAVDTAYPLYGEVELLGGSDFAPAIARSEAGQWGAVAEEALLIRLGLEVGDELAIGETVVQLRGVIDREPDRAAGGTFTLGPRLILSQAAMDETNLVREGSLVYYHYRIGLESGTPMLEAREALVAAFPDAGWRVRDHRNASPGLRDFIIRLTMFLTLTGLTALLVGGVGVGNAVRGYLEGKIATIAMLKCVGAPGPLIFKIYVLQTLALASVGVALGIVLGAAAPLTVAGLIEAVLPIRVDIGVDLIGLMLAALFGYLVSLIFSIWPIGHAQQVPAAALFRDHLTPQEGDPPRSYVALIAVLTLALAGIAVATSDHTGFAIAFVAGSVLVLLAFNFAGQALVKAAKRIKRPKQPGLRLALTNLYRPGTPAPAVVLSLGLGLTVLVTVALIEGNFARAVNDTIPADAPSFFFVDIQPDQLDGFQSLVDDIDGVADISATPMLRGRIVEVNGRPAAEMVVDQEEAWVLNGDRGITYEAVPQDQGTLMQGGWWPADYAGPPLVSIEESIAAAFGIGPGDEITVNIVGRNVTAEIANVRDIEWSSIRMNFTLLYAPGLLENAPQTFLATLNASPGAEIDVLRQVPGVFPNISMIRVRDALDTVNGILGNIATAVRVTAAVTLVSGTLVLAGAIAAGHRRRIYDSVVLKVLGATRWTVMRAYLMEYGILGIGTALIAGVVGTLTGYLVLTRLMYMEWSFMPSAVIQTVLIAAAITVTLGFIGTWRALGQKAAPLLRNQ